MHVVFIPKNEFNEDGLLLDSFVFGERERESEWSLREREGKYPPSVPLSQKQELAVWSPAPFFCIITQVTENQNIGIMISNTCITKKN